MWPPGDPREEAARAAAARLQSAKDDPWSSRSALRGAPLPSPPVGSDSSTGSDRGRPRAPLATPVASAPATARTSVSSDGPASSYTSALSCQVSWEAAALQDAYDSASQHNHQQHLQPQQRGQISNGRRSSAKGSSSSSGGDGTSSDSSFRRDHTRRHSTNSTHHNPVPAGVAPRIHGNSSSSSRRTSTYHRGYAAQPGSYLHTPTFDLSTSSSSEDEGSYVTGNSVLYGIDSSYFPSDNSNSSVDIRQLLAASTQAAAGSGTSAAAGLAALGPLAAAAAGAPGPWRGSSPHSSSASHPAPGFGAAAGQQIKARMGSAVTGKAAGGLPAEAIKEGIMQEGPAVVPGHTHPFSSASSSKGGPQGPTLHTITPLLVPTSSSSGSFTTTTTSGSSSSLRGLTIRPAAGRGRGCMDSATSIGQYRKAAAASGGLGSSSGLGKSLSGSLSRAPSLPSAASGTLGAAEQQVGDAAPAPAAVAEGEGGTAGHSTNLSGGRQLGQPPLASPFSSSSNVGPFSSSGAGIAAPSSSTSLRLLPGMCDVMSSGGLPYGGLLGPALSVEAAEGRVGVTEAPTAPAAPPLLAAAAGGSSNGHQHVPFSSTAPDAVHQATSRPSAAPSPSPRAVFHNPSHPDMEDGSGMGGARGKKQARGGQGRVRRHSMAASVLRPPLITAAPAPPPLLTAVIDSATSCLVSTSAALLGHPGDTSGDEAPTYLSASGPAAAATSSTMGVVTRTSSSGMTTGLLGPGGSTPAAVAAARVYGASPGAVSSTGASSSRRRHSDMVIPHQARQLSGWWAGYHGQQHQIPHQQQGAAMGGISSSSSSRRRRSFLETSPFMEAAAPAAAAAAAASLLGGLQRQLSAPEQLIAAAVLPPPRAVTAATAARVSPGPSLGDASSSAPAVASPTPPSLAAAVTVGVQQQVTVLAAAPLHAQQPQQQQQQQQQQPQAPLSSQEMWVADTLACLRAAAAHRAAADQVDPIQKAEQLLARFPDGTLPPWLITTLRSAAASAAEARRQRLAAGQQGSSALGVSSAPVPVAGVGGAAAAGRGVYSPPAAANGGGGVRVPASPFAAAMSVAGISNGPGWPAQYNAVASFAVAPAEGPQYYLQQQQQQQQLQPVGQPWQAMHPQQQQQHYQAGALYPVYQGAVQALPVSIKVAGEPDDFSAASMHLTQLATNALTHHLSPTHPTPGAPSGSPAAAPVVHQLHSCVVRGCVHLLGALFMAAEPGQGAGGAPEVSAAGAEVVEVATAAMPAAGVGTEVVPGHGGQVGATGSEVVATAAAGTPAAPAGSSSSSSSGEGGGHMGAAGGVTAASGPAAGVAAAVRAVLLQAGSEGQVVIGAGPTDDVQQQVAGSQGQEGAGTDATHNSGSSSGDGGAWLYPPVLTAQRREAPEFSGFSSSGQSNSTTNSCRQSVVLVLSGPTLAAAAAAAAEGVQHSSRIRAGDGAVAVAAATQTVRRPLHTTASTSQRSSSSDTQSSARRSHLHSSSGSSSGSSSSRRRRSRSPTGRCSRHPPMAGAVGPFLAAGAAAAGAGGAEVNSSGGAVNPPPGGGQGLRLVVFQAGGRVLLDEDHVVLQNNCIRFEVDVAAAAGGPTATDRHQRHPTHRRHPMDNPQQQQSEEELGVVFVVLLHGAVVLVPALPLPLLPAPAAAELNSFWAAVACHAASSPSPSAAAVAAAAADTLSSRSSGSSRRVLELEPAAVEEGSVPTGAVTGSEATLTAAAAAGLERAQSRQFLQALATAGPSVPITEDSAAMLAHGGMPQGVFLPLTSRGHPLLRRWWQQRWPNDWTTAVFRCLLVDPAAMAAATEAHLQRVLPVLVDVAAVLAAAATAGVGTPQPGTLAQAGRSTAAVEGVEGGGQQASERSLPASGAASGAAVGDTAAGAQHPGVAASRASGSGVGASNQVSSDDSAGVSLRVTRYSSSGGGGSAAGTGSAAAGDAAASAPGAVAAPAAAQGRLLVHSVLTQLLPYLAHLGLWGSITALCAAAGVSSSDAVQQVMGTAEAAAAAAAAGGRLGGERLEVRQQQQQTTSPFAAAASSAGGTLQPWQDTVSAESPRSGVHSSLERHASVPVQFQEHWQQLRQADHAAWLSRQHSDTLLVVQTAAGGDAAEGSGPGAAAAAAAMGRSASVPLPGGFVTAASAAAAAPGGTTGVSGVSRTPAAPVAPAAGGDSRGFARPPTAAPHAQLLSLQQTPSHQPVWAVIDQPWSVSSPTPDPTPVLRSPRTSMSVEAAPPVISGPAAVLRAAAAADNHGNGLTARQEGRGQAGGGSRRRRGLSWRAAAYSGSGGPLFTPQSAPASPTAGRRAPPTAPSAASGLQVDMRGTSSNASTTPTPGAGSTPTAAGRAPGPPFHQQQVRSGVPNGRLSLDSAYELYAGAGAMSGQLSSSFNTAASGLAALTEGGTGDSGAGGSGGGFSSAAAGGGRGGGAGGSRPHVGGRLSTAVAAPGTAVGSNAPAAEVPVRARAGRQWWIQDTPDDAAPSGDDWQEVEGDSVDMLAAQAAPAAAAASPVSEQAVSPSSSSQLYHSALSAAFGSRSGPPATSSIRTGTTTSVSSSRGHSVDIQGSLVGTEPVTPTSGSYTHTHAATPVSSRRRSNPSTAVTITTDGSSGSYKSLLSVQLPSSYHVGDLDSAQFSTPLVGPLEGADEGREPGSAWSPTSVAAHSQPPLTALASPPPAAAATAARDVAVHPEAPSPGVSGAGRACRAASHSADLAVVSTGISDSSSSHVGPLSAAAADGLEMDSLAAEAAATSSLAAELLNGGGVSQPWDHTTPAPGRRVVPVSGTTSSSLCCSRSNRGASCRQDPSRAGQAHAPAVAAGADPTTAAPAAAPVVVRLTTVNPRLLVPLEDGTGTPRAVQVHVGVQQPHAPAALAAVPAPGAPRAAAAGESVPAQSLVTQLNLLPSLQAGIGQLSTVEETASTPFAAQSQVLLCNSSNSAALPSPPAAAGGTPALPGINMYRRSSSVATDASEDTQVPPVVWSSLWRSETLPPGSPPALALVTQSAVSPGAANAASINSSSGVSAVSVAAALLGRIPPTTAAATTAASPAAATIHTTQWASIPEDVAVSSGVREQMCGVTFDQDLTGDLVTPATGWLNTGGSSWGSVSLSSGSDFGALAAAANSATAAGRAGGGYLSGGVQWHVWPPNGNAGGPGPQQASQGDTTAAAAAGATRASSSASSVPAAQQATLAAAAAAAKQALPGSGGALTSAASEPTIQPAAGAGGGGGEGSARGGTFEKITQAKRPRWWFSLGRIAKQRHNVVQDSALSSQLSCGSGSFASGTPASPIDAGVTSHGSSTGTRRPASSRHVQLLSDSSNVMPLPAITGSSSSCVAAAAGEAPAVGAMEAEQAPERAMVPMCGLGMGCWGRTSTAALRGVDRATAQVAAAQQAEGRAASASTPRGRQLQCQQGSSSSSSSSSAGGPGMVRRLQELLRSA